MDRLRRAISAAANKLATAFVPTEEERQRALLEAQAGRGGYAPLSGSAREPSSIVAQHIPELSLLSPTSPLFVAAQPPANGQAPQRIDRAMAQAISAAAQHDEDAERAKQGLPPLTLEQRLLGTGSVASSSASSAAPPGHDKHEPLFEVEVPVSSASSTPLLSAESKEPAAQGRVEVTRRSPEREGFVEVNLDDAARRELLDVSVRHGREGKWWWPPVVVATSVNGRLSIENYVRMVIPGFPAYVGIIFAVAAILMNYTVLHGTTGLGSPSDTLGRDNRGIDWLDKIITVAYSTPFWVSTHTFFQTLLPHTQNHAWKIVREVLAIALGLYFGVGNFIGSIYINQNTVKIGLSNTAKFFTQLKQSLHGQSRDIRIAVGLILTGLLAGFLGAASASAIINLINGIDRLILFDFINTVELPFPLRLPFIIVGGIIGFFAVTNTIMVFNEPEVRVPRCLPLRFANPLPLPSHLTRPRKIAAGTVGAVVPLLGSVAFGLNAWQLLVRREWHVAIGLGFFAALGTALSYMPFVTRWAAQCCPRRPHFEEQEVLSPPAPPGSAPPGPLGSRPGSPSYRKLLDTDSSSSLHDPNHGYSAEEMQVLLSQLTQRQSNVEVVRPFPLRWDGSKEDYEEFVADAQQKLAQKKGVLFVINVNGIGIDLKPKGEQTEQWVTVIAVPNHEKVYTLHCFDSANNHEHQKKTRKFLAPVFQPPYREFFAHLVRRQDSKTVNSGAWAIYNAMKKLNKDYPNKDITQLRREHNGILLLHAYLQSVGNLKARLSAPLVRGANLDDPNYWYSAEDIDALINEQLPPGRNDIIVYRPIAPCMQGVPEQEFREPLMDIAQAIQRNQTVILPINPTTQPFTGLLGGQGVGTHWVLAVVTPAAGGRCQIDYYDSLNRPGDQNFVAGLFNRMFGAVELNMAFNFVVHPTQQQRFDVDCGAWEVDNARQYINGQAPRSYRDISGAQLRQAHQQLLQQRQQRFAAQRAARTAAPLASGSTSSSITSASGSAPPSAGAATAQCAVSGCSKPSQHVCKSCQMRVCGSCSVENEGRPICMPCAGKSLDEFFAPIS